MSKYTIIKIENNLNNNINIIYVYSNISTLDIKSNQKLQIKILISYKIIRREYSTP